MTRIRTIKPDFFLSEDTGSLTVNARLLYVALWCQVDRAGRGQYRRTALMAHTMPFEMNRFDKCWDELVSKGHVRMYEVEGKKFFDIPTFTEHQRPHKTERQSQIPEFPGSLTVNSPSLNGKEMEMEMEMEGNKEATNVASSQETITPPGEEEGEVEIFIKLRLVDGSEYPVPVPDVEKYRGLYPAVNVWQELRSMCGWLDGNPTKRKTKRGIKRFITTWLCDKQDKGGGPAARRAPLSPGLALLKESAR